MLDNNAFSKHIFLNNLSIPIMKDAYLKIIRFTNNFFFAFYLKFSIIFTISLIISTKTDSRENKSEPLF